MRQATVRRAVTAFMGDQPIALTWEEVPMYNPASSDSLTGLFGDSTSTLCQGSVKVYNDEMFEDDREKIEEGWDHHDVLTSQLHCALRYYDIEPSSVDQYTLKMARSSLGTYYEDSEDGEDGERGRQYLDRNRLPYFLSDPKEKGYAGDHMKKWLYHEQNLFMRLNGAAQDVLYSYAPGPDDSATNFRINQLPSHGTIRDTMQDPNPDAKEQCNAFQDLLEQIRDFPGSDQAGCEALCRAVKGSSDVAFRPFSEYEAARDRSGEDEE